MRRLFGLFLILLSFSCPLLAEEAPTPGAYSGAARAFAIDNLTFALYHEMGHLLISEFSIPILGRHEDAADNIATMLLLAKQAQSADKALMNSARGWMRSARNDDVSRGNNTIGLASLYSEHSSDAMRATQIGCMMMGSKRDVFSNIALELGLTEENLEDCSKNLGQIVRSWMRIRANIVTLGTPTAPISITYEPDANFMFEAALLRDAAIFEEAVDLFLLSYALPRPISLVAKSCGTPNAYYNPENGELLLCYELVKRFLSLETS